MSTLERRQVSRTTMERLAYIHIDPNNGGIVLNVSGEGLCFHSMALVERNGPLRFSLLEQNRRIAACGELAWTDKTRKVAGVRFAALTAEAREQIHNWISQPAAPREEQPVSTLGSALLKAFPRFRVHRPVPNTDSEKSFALASALLRVRVGMRLSGFSRGLATGLFVSALLGSIFLLYANRREFGESLIHLGERLAAKPEPERQTALRTPQRVSSTKETVSAVGPQLPARIQTPARAPLSKLAPPPVKAKSPAERPKTLVAPPSASTAKAPQVTLSLPELPITASRPADGPILRSPTFRALGEAAPSPRPAVPLGALESPAATVFPNNPGPPASVETETANPVGSSAASSVSPAQMFFELDRFKDELWAHNLSDKLAYLGLHASVIQKGFLWKNSYYVLVGPYSGEEEATRVQKDLVSHGYKPRPFERGSRNFIFASRLTLNGTRLPVGDLIISWESYVANAKVKFAQGNYVLATADGRWIKQLWRYQRDEYVYAKGNNGSGMLLEIHLSGLDRALVFRNSR